MAAAPRHVPVDRPRPIAAARADAPAPLLARIDTLILAAAARGGAILVAADITQRWILPERTWTLDIDGRFNAETWFHSLVLAGAALAAFGIAATHTTRDRRLLVWLFVGATLAFMSFDKSISFHERLGESLEDRFELHEQAGRVLWQLIYAPLLAAFAFTLFVAVRTHHRPRAWVIAGIAACGSKLLLEAAMFPLIKWDVTSEQGVLYGIEANIEESVQLLGFALFFGVLARLFLDRITDLAPQLHALNPDPVRPSVTAIDRAP